MIHKRGLKGLIIFTLLLILTFSFPAAAAAGTVYDIKNNSIRIGDDIYELNHTNSYTYENVLDSVRRGGSKYYFKIDGRWYDLLRSDINSLSDLLDPGKAVPEAEVRTWLLAYRYGAGDSRELLEPIASTYILDLGFSGEAILQDENIDVELALANAELGAVGYDAVYLQFNAAGSGSVVFKTNAGGDEYVFENEGSLDAFSLPAFYIGSIDWTLRFSSAGDYTIAFKLVEAASGKVIAECAQNVRVYPSRDAVLAGLDARIQAALEELELENTGVTGVVYEERSGLVRIDDPGAAVAEFVQSLIRAFKGPLDDVTGVHVYVGGEKAGFIENPAGMSDAALIAALGEALVQPLVGEGKPWSEAVLGDLAGKSAVIEVIVTLEAAVYSAIYELKFDVNRYLVSVIAENGTAEGAGYHAVGSPVTLVATAAAGYEFYNWCDGEGKEVSKSNPYTFTMPNRNVELVANFFRSEAVIDADSALSESYARVHVEGDDVTVDLCGNTVVNLTVSGSNAALKNGTIINLAIGRGVENLILDNISDGEGGSHVFAGGGSGSILLRGQTRLKGTVYITSREALGIKADSPQAVIAGNVVVKTIMPVTINAPVQGELRILASSEPVVIKSEVARITALASTVIKICRSLDESKRPRLAKAAGVEVTAGIVDEQGQDTGEAVDIEESEDLSPAEPFIFSIDQVSADVKVNDSYILPTVVEAILSDRSKVLVAVEWDPPAADASAAGVFTFKGTVAGYDDEVVLTLTVYKTHIVSFNTGGGSAVEEQEVRHGETAVEPPEPARIGYAFAGWFKDTAFTDPWDFNEDRVTESITLHARWAANNYEVTFDANGGDEPSFTSKTVTYDSAYGELPVAVREGYTFAGWFTDPEGGIEITADDRVSIAGDHTLYAHWNINRYTVTFVDYDGTVLKTETVEHGGSATAPEAPEREGYAFVGWDTIFEEVKSDLIVTAVYIDNLVVPLGDLIESSRNRTRPDYTANIAEWDYYWNNFLTALAGAEQLYAQLKGVEELTAEQKTSINSAMGDLQRELEILDGIEDFDVALGDREHPKGLVETVYERSLVSDGFQPGRLRCYYDKENCYFYWLMSRYLQGQGYYEGTTGSGMNPGLQNVMLSESIIRLQSSDKTVEIYHPDGTRKTKKELETEGIDLAMYWLYDLGVGQTWTYADLVDFEIDCQLVGRTSDGTEFVRTYTFKFLDAGVYLFDPHFRYCVVDGVVQRQVEDFKIFNATKGIKYIDGTIQEAIDAADPGDTLYVARGSHNESLIINKEITLLGDYGDIYASGTGPTPPVLDGTGLSGAPGILVTAGNVTIRGFVIKNFDSGGIVVQGAGASNVTIESNYIHGVENGAVLGNIASIQALNNWSASYNKIENGPGIIIENVGELMINQNIISVDASGSGMAIGVTARADTASMTVTGITISGNEVSGGAVNVTALVTGSKSATVKNVAISNNTIVEGSVELLSGAVSSPGATIETVSISGNNIAFRDKGLSIVTRANAPGGQQHIKAVKIERNEITGPFTAIDIHTQETGSYHNLRDFTITGNSITVDNPEAAGCAVRLADVRGTNNNFNDNIITITGTADHAFDGLDISYSWTTGPWKWDMRRNILNGNHVGSGSSGIRLRGSLPGSAVVHMRRFKITGWTQGILADDLVPSATVIIQNSLIYDNAEFGILNGSGAAIEAADNYWGHPDGPYHESGNPNGQGNRVSDNVYFDPWYEDDSFY